MSVSVGSRDGARTETFVGRTIRIWRTTNVRVPLRVRSSIASLTAMSFSGRNTLSRCAAIAVLPFVPGAAVSVIHPAPRLSVSASVPRKTGVSSFSRGMQRMAIGASARAGMSGTLMTAVRIATCESTRANAQNASRIAPFAIKTRERSRLVRIALVYCFGFLSRLCRDRGYGVAVTAALNASPAARYTLRMFDERNELAARWERLTPREQEVFVRIVSGEINKQVAWQLGLSEKTIKIHRAHVMEKMGAHSFADLVRMDERMRPGTWPLFEQPAH